MKRLRTFLGLDGAKLTVFEKVWLGAPLAVWFSFQPLVRVGKDSTMYFELSIALLYATLLALSGLASIWQGRQRLLRDRAAWLVTLFVLICGKSLLWTPNLTRGVLTCGVIGVLYLVFLASVATAQRLKKLVPVLAKLFVVSAVIMSLLAIVQFVAGIWLGNGQTLLCAGCAAQQFGFPRPNVLTIEPQFFGNVLLAPALLALHFFLTKKRDGKIAATLVIITVALCLTLSRGALFSFGAGTLLLFVVHREHLKKIAAAFGLLVVSFIGCLLLQGTAASINPTTTDTFRSAVSSSINQLSLGVIDIPADEPKAGNTRNDAAPHFDGYVEESTDRRVDLTNLAIRTWADSPVRIVFGVGIGGSGVAMHQKFPHQIGEREIVQNEYVEVLLETGLFGALIFIATIAALLYKLRHEKWAWAIVLAFLLQWNFFSGYPNALHIYLVFVTLFVMATRRPGRKAPAKQY